MNQNLVNGSHLEYGGVFVTTHADINGEILSVEDPHNKVSLEGRVLLNKVNFGGLAATPFYIGLYANNYQIQDADTAVSFLTSASEVTAYDETSRQLYNCLVDELGGINNTANKAVFTANATVTVRGAMMMTSAVKGGTSGTVLSAVLFGAPKNLTAGDTLTVEYKFTTSSSV